MSDTKTIGAEKSSDAKSGLKGITAKVRAAKRSTDEIMQDKAARLKTFIADTGARLDEAKTELAKIEAYLEASL